MEKSSLGLIIGGFMGFILISGIGEIICGNLEVTGNVTAENVFIPTHAFGATNITQTVALADTWYTFNWSYTHIEGIWTLSNSTHMVVANQGHYKICFGASFIDASPVANSHNALKVNVNSFELNHSYIEFDLQKQNSEVWLSHCVEDNFIQGDAVSIQYISSDTDVTIESHGTYTTLVNYAFARMERMA